MNETRVEELGITPLKAELAAIDALKTKSDVARHFARFFKLNLINPMSATSTATRSSRRTTSSTCIRAASACPIATTTCKNDPTS